MFLFYASKSCLLIPLLLAARGDSDRHDGFYPSNPRPYCPQSTLPHGSPLGDRSMKVWLEFRSLILFKVV
jgi:hypothetical protein